MKTSICTNGFSIFISTLLLIFLYSAISCGGSQSSNNSDGDSGSTTKIIDHTCTDITYIPESAINQAKANLHIGYGHTSHGSQVPDGMTGLVGFANNGGLGLDLPDNFFQFDANGNDGGNSLHLFEGAGYNAGWSGVN